MFVGGYVEWGRWEQNTFTYSELLFVEGYMECEAWEANSFDTVNCCL